MKHFKYSRTVLKPLPDDPSRSQTALVEVELRGLVPNYDQLPESEEARYRPLVDGYGQLESEATQLGIWSDVLAEAKRVGVATIEDHWDRLAALDKIYKEKRQLPKGEAK